MIHNKINKIMKTIYKVKKLILSAAFLAASITTVAQVGIGTTEPEATLDIEGSVLRIKQSAFGAPTTGKGLELRTPSATLSEIYAFNRDGSIFMDIGIGLNSNQIYLKQNGNVGIGISNPSHRFEIHPNSIGLTTGSNTLF